MLRPGGARGVVSSRLDAQCVLGYRATILHRWLPGQRCRGAGHMTWPWWGRGRWCTCKNEEVVN